MSNDPQAEFPGISGFSRCNVFLHAGVLPDLPLSNAGVKRVVDVRLNNVSQLAGFTKQDDLAYFLKAIGDCEYRHEPLLAPTKEILAGYKKKRMDWEEYEIRFRKLLEERQAHRLVTGEELKDACLLCSEPIPGKCHRRLVAEYMAQKFEGLGIYHLLATSNIKM